MRSYRGDYSVQGKKVIDSDGLKTITLLLETHLRRIGADPTTWDTLYSWDEDNSFWLLSYEQPEMHGGGIEVLREISRNDANEFTKRHRTDEPQQAVGGDSVRAADGPH